MAKLPLSSMMSGGVVASNIPGIGFESFAPTGGLARATGLSQLGGLGSFANSIGSKAAGALLPGGLYGNTSLGTLASGTAGDSAISTIFGVGDVSSIGSVGGFGFGNFNVLQQGDGPLGGLLGFEGFDVFQEGFGGGPAESPGLAKFFVQMQELVDSLALGEEEGEHVADGTNAKIRLATGWGQSLIMHDLASQTMPADQYIELSNSMNSFLNNPLGRVVGAIQNAREGLDTLDGGLPGIGEFAGDVFGESENYNFIRMNQEKLDKLFFIRAAGFQLNMVKGSNMRIVEDGSEIIWIQKGNLLRVTEGVELRHNTAGIYWAKFVHVFKTGEKPIFPVIIAHKPWPCWWTGHVHFDVPSLSVFASE